jgi:hypothetical protein
MGSILPVATTLFAKSPRSTLASFEGSILVPPVDAITAPGNDQDHNDCRYRTPDDNSLTPLLPATAIAFHDRLLLQFKSQTLRTAIHLVVTGETSGKFPEKLSSRRDGSCPSHAGNWMRDRSRHVLRPSRQEKESGQSRLQLGLSSDCTAPI